MTRKSSRKWLIALISLLFTPALYEAVKACADGEWFSSYDSNFAPEAFVNDTTLTPFFYDAFNFYYYVGPDWDGSYDNNYDTRFSQVNVYEWRDYLRNSVDSATIGYFLNTASAASVKTTYNWFNGKRDLPDSLSLLASKLNRKDDRQRLFMRYLTLAKAAETYANNVYPSWYYDEDKPTINWAELSYLADEFEGGLKNNKDVFMKERYWFQLVRYQYFVKPDLATKAFEKYRAEFPADNMFYRTMAYAAGAYKKIGQVSRANYYYSLVFANDRMLRTVAHFSFHPQEEADWDETLAICKSADERATLWQMLGIFYGDEVRSMREIYKLNPASDKIDVLLTRFVNKVENPGKDTAEDSINNQLNYIIPVSAWVCQVADEGRVSNKFLWDTAAGYLRFLHGDNDEADKYYAKAGQVIDKGDTLQANQLRLLSLINRVDELDGITTADENDLLGDLQWLFKHERGSWDYNRTAFRTDRAIAWVRKTIARKYAAQGDIIKAECYYGETDFFTDDGQMNDYRAFFERANDTPYNEFCKSVAPISLKDVYEYTAIRMTLADKDLASALLLFQKVKPDTLPGDPFLGTIADDHDRDHAAPQSVKYTQATLVSKLMDLQKAIKAGRNVYDNALLLGNAFYNISYYGNCRDFSACKVISNGWDGGYDKYDYYDYTPSDPQFYNWHFRPTVIDNSVAYYYYSIATDAAQTRERKAKALFMKAKCERNTWYNERHYNNEDNEYHFPWEGNTRIDFVTWDSFKALRKYKDTEFYKEAIKECGYFSKAMGSK